MRIKIVLGIILLAPLLAFSQDLKDGEISAKIFANYHTEIFGNEPTSAMEIRRAYFGYKKHLSENFYAEVKLDIGSPNDISDYDRFKRYAYFKNAYLAYKKDKLTLYFGLADAYTFKLQEKFWGYRYIYKSFMDKHSYGASADIGVLAKYDLSEHLSLDASILNGEGYSQLQSDNNYKFTLGATAKFNRFTFRLYMDHYTTSVGESTFAAFAGYEIKNKFRFGSEFMYKINEKSYREFNRYGVSAYATYYLNEKIKLFTRYDHSYSVILEDDSSPWDLGNDGSAIISGVEYSPIKNIQFALNYQDWVPYAKNIDGEQFIYVNIQVVF